MGPAAGSGCFLGGAESMAGRGDGSVSSLGNVTASVSGLLSRESPASLLSDSDPQARVETEEGPLDTSGPLIS